MKVINTYIVDNETHSGKGIIFECENNKWYYQMQVLQNSGFETIILEISPSRAKDLI